MFKKIKAKLSAQRLNEEKLYAYVLDEMDQGIKRNGLWAKAISDARGIDGKAEALYIKYRVQSLYDEGNILDLVLDEVRKTEKEYESLQAINQEEERAEEERAEEEKERISKEEKKKEKRAASIIKSNEDNGRIVSKEEKDLKDLKDRINKAKVAAGY